MTESGHTQETQDMLRFDNPSEQWRAEGDEFEPSAGQSPRQFLNPVYAQTELTDTRWRRLHGECDAALPWWKITAVLSI